ncbi:unnamed protein product, partial [Larinioides sclopetarius]
TAEQPEAFITAVSVQCQKATDAFKCPQQFGYFRDTTDCNKYFICVFGDALHDKCTPGLYFNDELRMCDWPRNVKDCQSGLSGAGSETTGRRIYGTSTSRPRSSSSSSRPSYHRNENIHSPNSIAPANPTQDTRTGSRYTPPISIGESYAVASRNASQFQPSSYRRPSSHTTVRAHPATSARPYLYSTGPPASFKPVYYRVTKPASPTGPTRDSSSNKRKVYEDDYYDSEYEDDESSIEEPQMMVNQHLRSGNNLYVRPITIANVRTSAAPRPAPSSRPTYNSNGNILRGPPNTRNTNIQPKVTYSSFNNRGQSRPSAYDSRESVENDRTSYNRNIIRAAAPTHGSNVRSRTSNSNSNRNSALSSTYTSNPRNTDSLIHLRPQVSNDRGIQSLDNGGESLDAQFGTNPRAISLPDRPYRNPNSFESSSELRKAERNHQQQYSKPKVSSTRFSAPARPAYKTEDSSEESYDEYPEYYYDDEDYEDDDDVQNISPVPKVVIRLQKPSSTTRKTTTTTTTTTTRRPITTTRRLIPPATTKPPKRGLPFGISRPATKPAFKVGPKPLPKLPSRPESAYPTPRPLTVAEKCTSRNCVLPDCRCPTAEIPGKIPARDIPQIVLITFDDAVNDLNYELYAELFDSRKNPNGCPILGTFYVSHEWTDYGMVQSLYSKGHEMASHSITHSHGEKFSVSRWTQEIAGQREILHLYGGVKLEDIRGMRAPFLQVGGNNMFESLYINNFTYDSSMPVLDNSPPFFPYTLDYNIGHECMIPPCPTKSFPGLWEVGMVMWNDYRGGRCSMGDACANPDNAEDVFKMLLKNFERHYNSNRAPFGLFYHAAWFTTQHYRKGYMKFIDYINSKDDVYMVTNWQAIQWMREPTPLSRIQSFKPWQCPKDSEKPGPCHHPKACNLNYKGGSRSLKTCQPCPSVFPWTGRTGFNEVYAV